MKRLNFLLLFSVPRSTDLLDWFVTLERQTAPLDQAVSKEGFALSPSTERKVIRFLELARI